MTEKEEQLTLLVVFHQCFRGRNALRVSQVDLQTCKSSLSEPRRAPVHSLHNPIISTSTFGVSVNAGRLTLYASVYPNDLQRRRREVWGLHVVQMVVVFAEGGRLLLNLRVS